MNNRKTDQSQEEILRFLVEQAKWRWGEGYAASVQDSLEGTARQLYELGQNLPDANTEPGYYQ